MRDNANANAISNIESRTDFYIQLAYFSKAVGIDMITNKSAGDDT